MGGEKAFGEIEVDGREAVKIERKREVIQKKIISFDLLVVCYKKLLQTENNKNIKVVSTLRYKFLTQLVYMLYL